MRKPKPEALKAEKVMVVLPPSFRKYFQELEESPTRHLQHHIASEVLGVTLEDFARVYGDEKRDQRFKRDTPAQEFIRAARWILESRIMGYHVISPSSGVDLQVRWEVPGVTTDVTINLMNTFKGFRHVIYDDSIVGVRTEQYMPLTKDNIDDFLIRYSFSTPTSSIHPFKIKVLKAWIKETKRQLHMETNTNA